MPAWLTCHIPCPPPLPPWRRSRVNAEYREVVERRVYTGGCTACLYRCCRMMYRLPVPLLPHGVPPRARVHVLLDARAARPAKQGGGGCCLLILWRGAGLALALLSLCPPACKPACPPASPPSCVLACLLAALPVPLLQ